MQSAFALHAHSDPLFVQSPVETTTSATTCPRGERGVRLYSHPPARPRANAALAGSARAARCARPWRTRSRCTVNSAFRPANCPFGSRAPHRPPLAHRSHRAEGRPRPRRAPPPLAHPTPRPRSRSRSCSYANRAQKAIEDCKHRMSRYSVTPNVRGTTLHPCPRDPYRPVLRRAAQMLIVAPQVSAAPISHSLQTRPVPCTCAPLEMEVGRSKPLASMLEVSAAPPHVEIGPST